MHSACGCLAPACALNGVAAAPVPAASAARHGLWGLNRIGLVERPCVSAGTQLRLPAVQSRDHAAPQQMDGFTCRATQRVAAILASRVASSRVASRGHVAGACCTQSESDESEELLVSS